MRHGFGKLDEDEMRNVVLSNLGRRSGRVVVPPGPGLDNAVVSIGGKRVMIMTTDPVSMIPSVGAEDSAWLSVHLIASDFVTSGARPAYALFAYNLPADMGGVEMERYFAAVGRECARLGVSIVGGHTGFYPGAGYTVVGSGTMIGTAPEDCYVTPAMALEGDEVMMTKEAGLEAAAALAASFPSYLAQRVGGEAVERARRKMRSCSVVEDALAAASVGIREDGVTSMHDATEGGVLGALNEMSKASKKEFVVHMERIPVSGETLAVCSEFGLDPLTTLSEGALLLTCRPERSDEVIRRLRRRGITASAIGRVQKGQGLSLFKGGSVLRFEASRDRYWDAYFSAVRRRLR
jgi:hydrogenase expression/formation protein HypE